MLRSFDLESKWSALSLKARPETLVRPLIWGAAAVLLARVQPAPGAIPFALALLTAVLAAEIQPLFVLMGCLTGMFHSEGIQLGAALGAGIVLAGTPLARTLERWVQRRRGRASPERDGASALLAGLAVLLPGAALATGDPWQSLRIVACAIAAAASAPFMRALVQVRPTRRHLMPEERAGLLILLGAGMAGLGSAWMPAAMTAAMACILMAAPLGAGATACGGLGAGAAMMTVGLEPVRAVALGLCGLAAGLVSPKGRWRAPLVNCLCWLGCMVTLGVPWWDPFCALAAAGIRLAVPEDWENRARDWLSGEARGACDPDRLATRLRAESVRKLRALSAAFGELADGYRIPVDVPDEQSLIAGMREQLCENCPYYAQCWVGGDNRAVRFLCQLISEAIDWAGGDCAEPLFGEEMPPDVLRQCHRGRSIPARLGTLLEEFARKRRSEMKRGAVNQLISAQFMQAQMLLCGLADAQARPLRIRGRQAARARAALDRAGIEAREVMALRGTRQMELVATLAEGIWTPELAARASAQLTQVFGRPYAPGERTGGEEMKFVRLPRLRAVAGAANHACHPGSPSGDSHLIRTLDGDRLLLMLSDGMGSGEAAARESAQTLRLLSQFLAADVSRTLALETVNELMLARTDSDMFATVDLCLIDLATGMAEFSKLAACRSLILRKGEILEVEGGHLPLGILEGVRPSVTRVQLQPGDVIVMASDGIMDAVDPDVLAELLQTHAHQPPEMLSETLLDRARPDHQDDATVLCARIAQRRGRG